MKTEKFESVVNELSIQKCLQYSDNPDALKSLIESISVEVKFTGIKKHFTDDKEERLTGIFKISKGERSIEFDYGFSINDTETFSVKIQSFDSGRYKGKFYDRSYELVNVVNRDKKKFMDGLLYDCLVSCKSDFYVPIDFDDFCSEFGYDNDSIKAKTTWESCLKQSSKLQKIFTESEIEVLPS